MEDTSNNSTQSEAPSLAHLAEFDKGIRFLSELPTDRAMKDISNMRNCPEAVKKVVETMAFRKMDFIKVLRFQELRARLGSANRAADKAMQDFTDANPDYEVNITEK